MAYLLGLSMALVPYVLGKGALRLLYGSQNSDNRSRADNLLVGWMMVIGLAETAHLGAMVLGRSFSDCKNIFLVMLSVLLAAAVVVLYIDTKGRSQKGKGRENRRQDKSLSDAKQIVPALFGIVVLLQAVYLIVNTPVYPAGDMTVETVNTIRNTDSLYQINPMTGQGYELGMPFRLKILCLPTLYAVLCDVFRLSAMEVVWMVVPVMTLLTGYAAYYSISCVLFPKERENRFLFLLFVALLLQVGNYLPGMDGFAAQYALGRGVSIRAVILIPYVFSVILRKKWKLVILCILAEACIVWTLYGMGTCFLITVAMVILQYISGRISFPDKRSEAK